MKASIRNATHEDITDLIQISAQLSEEDGKIHGEAINHTWAEEFGNDAFIRSIDSPTSNILVAEVEGTLIGSLHGYIQGVPSWRSTPIAVIITLYTDSRFRGQGIGANLISAFESWAKENGATRIAVSAFVSNVGAQRFYERNGFGAFEVTLEKEIV